MEVFDNGDGLPVDLDISQSKTFGLQMIKGLVDQLNGKMENRKGSGTGFNIYVEDREVA